MIRERTVRKLNANANFLLNARAGEHGSVILSVIDTSSRINFIGASCPASAEPLTHGLTTLTVAPQKEKIGVLAVQVLHKPFGKHESYRDLCYLLTASYEIQPFVDLAAPFIPAADCLAQLTDYGLFVTFSNQKFVAPNYGCRQKDDITGWKATWAEQKIRMVNDPNLLCRLIAGDAAIEEVAKAAVISQAAEDLPAKYLALESLYATLEKSIKKLEAQRYTAASNARLVIARSLDLQQKVESIIHVARTARFGKRGKSLKKISLFLKEAQICRAHLENFKNSIPPEKKGD